MADRSALDAREAQLLEALAVAVLVVDARGEIVFTNHGARTMLAPSTKEPAPRSLDEIADGADDAHPLSLASIWAVLGGRRGATDVACSIRAGGRSLSVEVSVSRWVREPGALVLVCIRDASERRAVEARLRHASTHDALTGCFNRAYIEERRASLDAEDRGYCALIADVDGLKSVNDRLGHEAGDALIVAAAAAMNAAAAEGDIVARLGGDEFVLIVLGGDQEALARAAASIRRAASDAVVDEGAPRLALSVGGAVRRGREPLAAVMKRADQRMYADKGARRRATSASQT
ncbi:MAG: diguanylate cyclase [Myxococcales bacterium]|nr:diguanylate cyclase [Myxococcales bacterium]